MVRKSYESRKRCQVAIYAPRLYPGRRGRRTILRSVGVFSQEAEGTDPSVHVS